MSKYIIEIPDDTQYVLLNGQSDHKYYTAVHPIANLEELNSDYINKHYGEMQDEAYRKGYDKGRKVGIKDGMCEAWEAAKKIVRMPEGDLLDIFTECYSAVCTALQVLLKYDASEAIEKLKAYEELKDDNIKVGDEVESLDMKGNVIDGYLPWVVTTIQEHSMLGFDKNGLFHSNPKTDVRKTGKRYDIQSILEAMRK